MALTGGNLFSTNALGEGRCQAENITRELHRLSQSDDMEIKIAAIKALGRIYR
ncbi:HEAT repeat domain-containing protein [Escherichia coli]